jgi:hypothetical protein
MTSCISCGNVVKLVEFGQCGTCYGRTLERNKYIRSMVSPYCSEKYICIMPTYAHPSGHCNMSLVKDDEMINYTINGNLRDQS